MIFVQAWVIEDILRAIGVGIFPLNSWSEGNSGLINVHYVGTGISDCGKTNGQGGKTVTFDVLIGGETMGKIVRWRKKAKDKKWFAEQIQKEFQFFSSRPKRFICNVMYV